MQHKLSSTLRNTAPKALVCLHTHAIPTIWRSRLRTKRVLKSQRLSDSHSPNSRTAAKNKRLQRLDCILEFWSLSEINSRFQKKWTGLLNLTKRRISLPWIRIWSCFHPMSVQSIAAVRKPLEWGLTGSTVLLISKHVCDRSLKPPCPVQKNQMECERASTRMACVSLTNLSKRRPWCQVFSLTPAILSTVCFQIPCCCRVHEMTDNLGSNVEYISTFEEASLGST